MPAAASEVTAERVLRAVEQVEAGTVVSYGDVAELTGTTARIVGAVMSRHGAEVAWWRVTNRQGRLPDHLLSEARRHWQDEGINTTAHGCAIAKHRADLEALARRYDLAVASL